LVDLVSFEGRAQAKYREQHKRDQFFHVLLLLALISSFRIKDSDTRHRNGANQGCGWRQQSIAGRIRCC
jgi:hypothetical protein